MSVRINATLRINRWEGARFIQRVPRVLAAYGQELNTQLREEITTAQFTWPRRTQRRNGLSVTSPRDIYDTGEFLRSQTLATSGRNRLTFTWNPQGDNGFPYARLIFTGYTTNRGSLVPGRDWMTPALVNLPPQRFFAQQWAALGR